MIPINDIHDCGCMQYIMYLMWSGMSATTVIILIAIMIMRYVDHVVFIEYNG